jgi:hypothetical protein
MVFTNTRQFKSILLGTFVFTPTILRRRSDSIFLRNAAAEMEEEDEHIQRNALSQDCPE